MRDGGTPSLSHSYIAGLRSWIYRVQTNNQQDTTTLKPKNDHRKAIQNARRAYGMERLSRTPPNLRMHNAHACYPQEK